MFVNSHNDLGVTVDSRLRFHAHVSSKVNTANAMLTNVLCCTVNRDASFLLNVYRSYIRPVLEYGSIIWNVGYVCDLISLERVQRRLTKAVCGLENLPYHDRLKALNLHSFRGRLLRSDLIFVWKVFNNLTSVSPNQIFILNDSSRRGHPFKIYKPRCELDIRKRYFSVRVINHWNSLSSNTVNSKSIQTFKRLLQLDLGNVLFEYCE